MIVTFYGAVREVTGSMHLVTTERDRILLDCGLYQGRRKESEHKNRMMPVDPRIVTNLVLSHAHIDHCGRIPLFVKKNFNGSVFCTRATADACSYLLADSAHIQESDALYLNYKTVRSFLYNLKTSPRTKTVSKREMRTIKSLLKKDAHELQAGAIGTLLDTHNLHKIQPLYTMDDAQKSLEYFSGYPYGKPVAIGRDMTCTFYDAGHILGSAFSIIKARENGRTYSICYTGDIGRFNKPIIQDPTLTFPDEDRNIDLLIMESTYGDREHEPAGGMKDKLKKAVSETFDRGGTVVIPSFAFGRTQELVYVLHELYDSREVPRMPIYVDSPLATNLTKVFGEHPEVYDEETHKTFLENSKNPFSFRQIQFVQSVGESMALMRDEKPHVVIASSGMCEAGRILHHLRYKIHDARNTILIVGYMAENTLGRRLLDSGSEYEQSGRTGPPPLLKFLNKVYPLKAHVVELGGFSAHGDKNEMLRFLKESNLNIKRIAVVHGEEHQSLAFADRLKREGYKTAAPHAGETLTVS